MFKLAEGLARANDVEGARRALPPIDSAAEVRGLVQFAATLEHAGATAAAAELLDTAVATVEHMQPVSRVFGLATIAAELDESGHRAQKAQFTKMALRLLQTTAWQSQLQRTRALAAVAAAVVNAEPAQALRLVKEVRSQLDAVPWMQRRSTSRTVIRCLIEAGEPRAGVDLARESSRKEPSAGYITWAAECLARFGAVEEALQLTDEPDFVAEQPWGVEGTLAALVQVGERDRAWTILERGDSATWSEAIQAMAPIVTTTAAPDEIKRWIGRAVPVGESLMPYQERAGALAGLALAAARVGEYAQARQLAHAAKDLAPLSLDLESTVHTVATFGLIHSSHARNAEAARLAAQALALEPKLPHDASRARASRSLVPLLVATGSLRKAKC